MTKKESEIPIIKERNKVTYYGDIYLEESDMLDSLPILDGIQIKIQMGLPTSNLKSHRLTVVPDGRCYTETMIHQFYINKFLAKMHELDIKEYMKYREILSKRGFIFDEMEQEAKPNHHAYS